MIINTIAMWVGYVIGGAGAAALSIYVFWWLVGRFLKYMGYWPLFYRTMMRVAYERNTRKAQNDKRT